MRIILLWQAIFAVAIPFFCCCLHPIEDNKLREHEIVIYYKNVSLEDPNPDKRDIPIFIEGLMDQNIYVRMKCARALGLIGPDAKEAEMIIIEMLKDEHPNVRSAAARTLGYIDADAEYAVPALTNALDDWFWGVRKSAAKSLGIIGSDAAGALAKLHVLAESDPHVSDGIYTVREAALNAIARIETSLLNYQDEEATKPNASINYNE